MPRKATVVNPDLLSHLKKIVLDEAGFTLKRSVDCDHLAKHISQKTTTYLNGITIKRIYGFTKYPFNPSIQTLDVLCQYIGFNNWYDFEVYLSDKKTISQQELAIYLSIYDIDLINEVIPREGAFQSVSRKIALRFRQDPNTLLKNLPNFVSKPYVQTFFVELFPDYDNLCLYYFNVFKTYLKFKHTKEAQLYGNCMLFLYSFWIQDQQRCSKYLKRINRLGVDEMIHPYVVGRYFACNLLYTSFYEKKKNTDQLYSDYLSLRKKLPKNDNQFFDFPASEYIVAEALLHCKQYKKCIEVIDKATHDYSLRMEFVRKGYYRQMQLIWLISSKKLNTKLDIREDLKKINPASFYFISQEYFTVLYYFAKGSKDDLEKAKSIAEKMGNQYLIKKFLRTPLSPPSPS